MAKKLDWTPERDAELRRLRDEGMRNADIAARMGDTLASVWGRCAELKLPRLARVPGQPRPRFWNEDRDTKLREMWDRVPQPSLREIRVAFEFGISESAISYRAVNVLKLHPRCAITRIGAAPKHEGYRSTFVGESPREAAATPKPRVVVTPSFTPCPYVDPARPLDPETGRVRCCGVTVDRRMRHGVKPSQYCADHAPRVTPGVGDGSRAGARYLGPVTRAGILGML